MAFNPELQEPQREPTEGEQLDQEGRDLGVSREAQTYDRKVPPGHNDNTQRTEPSGAKTTPGGEQGDQSTIEGEPAKDEVAPQFNGVALEHVSAVRSERGLSYFFIPPPEALRLGWESAIHIGDDDGSGGNIGPITEAAGILTGKLHKEIEEFQAKEKAASVNEDDDDDEFADDDESLQSVVVLGGETSTAGALHHAQMIHEQMSDYDKVSSEQTIGQVREGQPHFKDIENVPIESAGSAEFAPAEKHAVMDISEDIPQEARDTPQKPLDPNHPKTRVRGVIPPGEWVSEPQNIPSEPHGPKEPEPS